MADQQAGRQEGQGAGPLQAAANSSAQVGYLNDLQSSASISPRVQGLMQLQAAANGAGVVQRGKEGDGDGGGKKKKANGNKVIKDVAPLTPLSGVEGDIAIKETLLKAIGTIFNGKSSLSVQSSFLKAYGMALFEKGMRKRAYRGLEARKYCHGLIDEMSYLVILAQGSSFFAKEYGIPKKYTSEIQDFLVKMKDIVHGASLAGAGGGWEKKVLDIPDEKGGESLKKTLHDMKGRTATRYSFSNGGQQGPHTFARCFGLNAREDKVKEIAGSDYGSKPRAFLNSISDLYSTYAKPLSGPLIKHCAQSGSKDHSQIALKAMKDSRNEALGLIKSLSSSNGKEGESKKKYQTAVKHLSAGTLQAQTAFNKRAGTKNKYLPNIHALEAFEYYRTLFWTIQKVDPKAVGGLERQARLIMMWGQILADLHPYASSFKNNAPHSELAGGGEADAASKVKAFVADYKKFNLGDPKMSKEDARGKKPTEKQKILAFRKRRVTCMDGIKAAIIGGGKSKGLIDQLAVVSTPKALHKDFESFEVGTIVRILAIMGLSLEDAHEIAVHVVYGSAVVKLDPKRNRVGVNSSSKRKREEDKPEASSSDSNSNAIDIDKDD